jgi:hypothetical protein
LPVDLPDALVRQLPNHPGDLQCGHIQPVPERIKTAASTGLGAGGGQVGQLAFKPVV